VTGTRYRWVVLAVGTAAQASVAAAAISVAVLAPELRQEFGLSLGETGVALAAFGIGMTPTLLPWGLFTDRIGERLVLPLGLSTSAIALGCVGIASGFAQLVLLLVAAGALGASVNAASGRAVMHWFAPSERGLALGIRQANVPLGGLVAALALPPLADSAGLGWAFAALAGTCFAAALAGAALLREPTAAIAVAETHTPAPSKPLRDPALWRISSGSGLIVVGQIATMSFTVLYLSEGRGFSTRDAALVYAATQVVGGALRILLGHISDRSGSRIVPLCRAALAVSLTLALVALLAGLPNWALVPMLALAGGIGLSWNGLSFVAAAEIAGARASGAAIGLQQTLLGVAGIVAPIGFATLVAEGSWRIAFAVAALFPLAGWAVIRPLAATSRPRLHAPLASSTPVD
jgi:sugar phosphate permease